ncbi:fimbrial biogenesis outer membrane usher protein [Izhakiella australiensis]
MTRLAFALLVIIGAEHAQAEDYTFDASQLDGSAKNSDMALFNQGLQQPGTYSVDIVLNGETVDSGEVRFKLEKNAAGKPWLAPCLSVTQLARYGVKTDDYPALAANGGSADCANILAIPQAKALLDLNTQQLLLSIPQVALRPKPKGIAPRESWDDGITAFLLNYNASNIHTEYRSAAHSEENSWLQLQPGLNLGAWRIRNATSWQQSSDRPGHWQSSYIYASRGLYDLQSRLTLGQSNSSSEIFSGVPFTGVMLGSDDSMVPYNLRQFAPVVRGIARTQARVEVKQGGYVIYNQTIAPGPFALNDLAVNAGGGDLNVTVWETDGSPQTFTVAYQTPAIALHQGYFKYNLMAGRYRPTDPTAAKAPVVQATLMYGLPWNLTAYGGVQNAQHYNALSLGIGLSLGYWGSLSVDDTRARSQRQGKDWQQGSNWRIRYSNQLNATGSSFSLASSQYASSGYSTLSSVLDSYHRAGNGDAGANSNIRSSTDIALSQTLGEYGNLSLNASRTQWRGRSGHDDSWGLSYSTIIQGVSLTLNWSQSKACGREGESSRQQITSIGLSMPLSRWLGGNMNASWQMTSPSQGGESQTAGLSGQTFDRQLTWNVQQRYQAGSQPQERNNSTLQATWNGAYGQLGANYSYSQTSRQTGVNLAGGMIIHRHGVTFSQPLSDTVALVEAPGAAGVALYSWPGVKTDYRGYTTASGIGAYQENEVSLDPTQLPDNAEVLQTDKKVVPTQGAVVEARYKTRIGARALVQLTGAAIPFGAAVTVEDQPGGAGLIDDKGQAYLTGLPASGRLTVKWGDQQCHMDYQLPHRKGPGGLYQLSGVCR